MRLTVGIIALLFATLLAAATPTAAADSPYIISVSSTFGEGRSVPEIEAILREAYRRIGMAVDFAYYPLVRDAMATNEGQADACAIKTRYGVAGYPHLRVVPVPLLLSTHVALVSSKEQAALGPEQLRQLRFVAIRGDLVASALLGEKGITPYLAPSITHAIRMIRAGRADAVFATEAVARRAQEETPGHPMYRTGFSETVPGYHVVNVRHERLVAPLANVFREMMKDGATRRLAGKYGNLVPPTAKATGPGRH